MEKVGDGSTPLPDVTFKLYSDADCTQQITVLNGNGIGDPIYKEDDEGNLILDGDGNRVLVGYDGIIKTGNDGKNLIGKFTAGTYYLVETKTADGYYLLDTPVVLTVSLDENNIPSVTYKYGSMSAAQNAIRSQSDNMYHFIFTVDNKSGYALPHTGSARTILYTAFGVTMLLSVGAVLTIRLKKQEEE